MNQIAASPYLAETRRGRMAGARDRVAQTRASNRGRAELDAAPYPLSAVRSLRPWGAAVPAHRRTGYAERWIRCPAGLPGPVLSRPEARLAKITAPRRVVLVHPGQAYLVL